jgi:hypothetical protein
VGHGAKADARVTKRRSLITGLARLFGRSKSGSISQKTARKAINALALLRLTATYENLSQKLGENPERIMSLLPGTRRRHFNLFTLLQGGYILQTPVY